MTISAEHRLKKMQSFTGNDDILKWVKNYRLGRETNKLGPQNDDDGVKI